MSIKTQTYKIVYDCGCYPIDVILTICLNMVVSNRENEFINICIYIFEPIYSEKDMI